MCEGCKVVYINDFTSQNNYFCNYYLITLKTYIFNSKDKENINMIVVSYYKSNSLYSWIYSSFIGLRVLDFLTNEYFVAKLQPFELHAYSKYNLCKMSRHKWLRWAKTHFHLTNYFIKGKVTLSILVAKWIY